MAQTTFNKINASMDKSDHGMSHRLQGPCVGVLGLTSNRTLLVKCLFIFNWIWIKQVF